MSKRTHLQIRPLDTADQPWIISLFTAHWGSTKIITRGVMHEAHKLPGFIAVHRGQRAGLITYNIKDTWCEIISVNSLIEGIGIGSALINTVRETAEKTGCDRLWLITTNDNLQAIRLYQKRGFHLIAVHKNALEESRKIKPSIPLTGVDGIPLRDEIEMEMSLPHHELN